MTEFNAGNSQLRPLIPTLNPTLPRRSPPITSTNLSQLVSQVEMGPLGDVLQFVWSPDAEYVAINTLSAVWLYHVNTNEPNAVPIHLPPAAMTFWNEIGSIAFSSDSQTLATAGVPNGDLHLWGLSGTEEKVLHTQATDYAGITAIAPDLSRWAVAHRDGTITVWDGNTGSKLQTLSRHTIVGALAFTPDGATLVLVGGYPYSGAGGEGDNTIWLWNMATGDSGLIAELPSPPVGMTGIRSRIAIRADGNTAAVLAFSDQQNTANPLVVYVIDIANAAIHNPIPLTGYGTIGNTSLSAGGKMLAVNFLSSLSFFDMTNEVQIAQILFERNLQELAFSPDGRWLVVAHQDDNFNKSIIQFWGVG